MPTFVPWNTCKSKICKLLIMCRYWSTIHNKQITNYHSSFSLKASNACYTSCKVGIGGSFISLNLIIHFWALTEGEYINTCHYTHAHWPVTHVSMNRNKQKIFCNIWRLITRAKFHYNPSGIWNISQYFFPQTNQTNQWTAWCLHYHLQHVCGFTCK